MSVGQAVVYVGPVAAVYLSLFAVAAARVAQAARVAAAWSRWGDDR